MEKVFVLIGNIYNNYDVHYSTLDVYRNLIKYNINNDNNNIIIYSSRGKEGKSVYEMIYDRCQELKRILSDKEKKYYIGMTCNTQHLYFDECYNLLKTDNVYFFNVISLTVNYIIKKKYKYVGILSSNNTRKTGLYSYPLVNNNIKVIESDINQDKSIDDIKKNKNMEKHRSIFLDEINKFIKSGVDAVILGCSEIPLVIKEKKIHGVPMINTMKILVKNMIKY